MYISFEDENNCPDCGVNRGEYHKPGCDIESCPLCYEQMLSCNCMTNWLIENYGNKCKEKEDEDYIKDWLVENYGNKYEEFIKDKLERF